MDTAPDSTKSASHAESNVHPLPVTPKSIDPYIWEHVHSDYRTGLTYSHLSEKYAIPIPAIVKRRKNENWKRDLREDVQIEVAARLVADEMGEIPLGEASDDQLIDLAARGAVKVVRKHRIVLGDAMDAMAGIARQLRAFVEDVKADEQIPVIGKRRLSLSDAAEIGARLGAALDRLIKLERTTYGLDERVEEKPYEDRLRDWHAGLAPRKAVASGG